MRRRNITVTSIFVFLVSLVFLFMFRNGDSFFNMNEYRIVMFISVAAGLFALVFRIGKIHTKNVYTVFLILWCIGYMVFSKFIMGIPAEPYYILYISTLYLYILCMASLTFSKKQLRSLIDVYILSSVLISFICLLQHKTPYSGYGIFRLALYYEVDKYYDVNFTAMYLLIPTLLSFRIALKSREQKRIFYFLGTALNVLAILMMGSRGTFAPVLAIIVYEILTDRKASILKVLMIMTCIFAVTFLVPKDVIERLFVGKYFNLESKRLVDWKYGIDALKQALWFGNGMLAPKDIVAAVSGVDWYTVHNTYIVYLVQMGIVGAIPFFLVLFYPAIKLWNGIKKPFMWLTYCGLLFAALMIESNYTYSLIIPLSLIYALISYSMRNGIKDGMADIYNLQI